MATKTFTAPDISCGHCVNTIQTEVGDLEGVTSVVANHETKEVTVEWDAPQSWDNIKALLAEINFPPQEG